jgi:cytochrome c
VSYTSSPDTWSRDAVDRRTHDWSFLMQPLQLSRHASVAGPLLCIGMQALAAPEPAELIDRQHCMFCPTVDSPVLAPSLQQIAERYRNVPDAASMLEDKLRLGGPAHWGDMAMPAAAEMGIESLT